MNDLIKRVTNEKFLEAYNRHLPGKWTKFVFKYFSKSTLPQDLWLKKWAQGILLGLFGLGMLGAIFNATHTYMAITTLTFSALLILVVLIMSSGAILNNLRLRKVRKELGITRAEYEILAQLYLY